MHLLNTHLLCRKDNSGGHGSKVCIDDRFFQDKVLFLRKELNHKEKAISTFLNINYSHTNQNEFGESFYKNTNAQSI